MSASVFVPWARSAEHVKHPERTAIRDVYAPMSSGHFGDTEVRTWPNRAAMARAIRREQAHSSFGPRWLAVEPLGVTEGY